MIPPTLRYLSRGDVESLDIPMEEIIHAVEAALREKGLGTAEMPPKPGSPSRSPTAFIHAMPAFLGVWERPASSGYRVFPRTWNEVFPISAGSSSSMM